MYCPALTFAIMALQTSMVPPVVTVDVSVRTVEQQRTSAPIPVEIVAIPADPSAERVESLVSLNGTEARTKLALMAGVWTFQTKAAGWWASDTTLDVTHHTPKVDVKLWATAHISIDLPPDALASKELPVAVAHFRGTPTTAESHRVPDGVAVCLLGNPGRAMCEIPAGAVDVRLAIPSFAPQYNWNVQLRAGETVRLPFATSRGGSVVGYVRSEKGAPVTAARVELQTSRGTAIAPSSRRVGQPSDEQPEHHPSKRLETGTNHRGFFQIVGVAPGDYRIVSTASEGLVAIETVAVDKDKEAALRDFLVLQPPYGLEVSVDPPTDPAGRPWTITLVRLSPFQARTEHTVPSDGTTRLEEVGRGEYLIQLSAEGQRWLSQTIEVDAPPGPLFLRVPLVSLKGTVELGDRPLKATLTFGGRPSRAQSIVLEADKNGAFEGSLPRAGKWYVHVASEDPRVDRNIPNVEVVLDDSGRQATTSIRLHDGRLKGRVVDDTGSEIAAIVRLTGGSAATEFNQVFTGADGRFDLRGLPLGPTVIEAHSSAGQSDAVTLAVSDTAPSEVTLVTRERIEYEGIVLSAATGLPLPGAAVQAWPTDRLTTLSAPVISDAQGKFTLQVPAGTTAVAMLYRADGHAIGMGRAPLDKGRRLMLTAQGVGGTVIVELPASREKQGAASSVPVLIHGGAAFGLRGVSALTRTPSAAAPATESRVILDGLSPGEYTVCAVPSTEFSGFTPPRFDRTRCARGSLAPRGELNLTIPANIASH